MKVSTRNIFKKRGGRIFLRLTVHSIQYFLSSAASASKVYICYSGLRDTSNGALIYICTVYIQYIYYTVCIYILYIFIVVCMNLHFYQLKYHIGGIQTWYDAIKHIKTWYIKVIANEKSLETSVETKTSRPNHMLTPDFSQFLPLLASEPPQES